MQQLLLYPITTHGLASAVFPKTNAYILNLTPDLSSHTHRPSVWIICRLGGQVDFSPRIMSKSSRVGRGIPDGILYISTSVHVKACGNLSIHSTHITVYIQNYVQRIQYIQRLWNQSGLTKDKRIQLASYMKFLSGKIIPYMETISILLRYNTIKRMPATINVKYLTSM